MLAYRLSNIESPPIRKTILNSPCHIHIVQHTTPSYVKSEASPWVVVVIQEDVRMFFCIVMFTLLIKWFCLSGFVQVVSFKD